MNRFLFDKGDAPCPSPGEVAAAQAGGGTPRLRVPQRDQVEVHWASLDELIEPDHPVRAIWAVVCGLDFHGWLETIKAVEGAAGRDATDPRLLAALWIYATLEGIGSARELDRLCGKHWAYQWLCGGVSVNYHLLADFRSQGGEQWDELLTQIVASLLAENLVTMKRVAQDGMRVQANANEKTFRRSRQRSGGIAADAGATGGALPSTPRGSVGGRRIRFARCDRQGRRTRLHGLCSVERGKKAIGGRQESV